MGEQPTKQRGRVWRNTAGAASLSSWSRTAQGAEAPEGGIRPPWALKTRETLRPGEKGTKRLLAHYGERLVCVRYRCDAANRKRYKTVELIVAEADWTPPPGPDDLVGVRVAWAEEALRKRVKEAGGRWRPESKTWELPRRLASELGLEDRIV